MSDSKNYSNSVGTISNESSYMLRDVSFEDSQIDHFVPYSSPYILCWHNNKENLTDMTMNYSQNTNNQYSNISDIEKKRSEDLSISNLVQISVDKTLNFGKNIINKKPIKTCKNYSIDQYESDQSEIQELGKTTCVSNSKTDSSNVSRLYSQLQKLDLNQTEKSMPSLLPYPTESSNDFLTNVTSKSIITIEDRSSCSSFHTRDSFKRVQNIILNQTPSINLLGVNSKLKNNLNILFNQNSLCDSIKKKVSSNISEDSVFETSSHSQNSQKINNIGTSPIRFIALSPTTSLAPSETSKILLENESLSQRDCNSDVSTPVPKPLLSSTSATPNIGKKTLSINETKHCDELRKKSVEKIEFSYSEINENVEKKESIKTLNESTNLTSVSETQINNSPKSFNKIINDKTNEIVNEDDDIELDEDFIRLINKNVKKMIKKSFEKSKRLSLNVSNSTIESCHSTHSQSSDNVERPEESFNKQIETTVYNTINKSILSEKNAASLEKINPVKKQKSEVATQTSFIYNKDDQEKNHLKENGENLKVIDQNKKQKQIKKQKIKEMLLAQKQQHEKRVKALERLTKIEQQQAEKLNLLIQNSHGESILSNSYFQDKFLTENRDRTIELSDLDSTDKNRWMKRKSKIFDDILKETENSFPETKNKNNNVEVISLQNTTVHKQPKGVHVIKEKRKIFNTQQVNEIHTNQGDRLIFSNIGNSIYKNENRHKSIFSSPMKTPSIINLKSEAWFLPITPNCDLKRLDSAKKENSNIESSIKKWNQFKSMAADMKLNTIQAKTDSIEKQNLSLQKAFEIHKRHLIDRSMRRQNDIQSRSKQRYQEAEFKRKYDELILAKKLEQQEAEIRARQERLNRLKNRSTNCNNLTEFLEKPEEVPLRKRRMSVQDIYNQNKKNYEKLPEVQLRQKLQRLEEAKRFNRMKLSIFKKTIQQSVLTNGPNFDHKYKAIENFDSK